MESSAAVRTSEGVPGGPGSRLHRGGGLWPPPQDQKPRSRPQVTRRRRNCRLPSCSTRPSSAATGRSRARRQRLAVEPDPALGELAPRLRPGAPEERRDQPRAGARPRRRGHRGLLDLRRQLVGDEHAVEAPPRPRRPRPPVEARDQRARERALRVARPTRPRARAGPSSSEYHAASAASGMRSVLPYISAGGSVIPMWLPSDFDIFCTPSMPVSSGMVSTTCGALPVRALDRAAHQQVERLVGPAELDVGARSPPSRSPGAPGRAARAARSARRRRSAWRSRRARAAARPSDGARAGTGPPSTCPATRSCSRTSSASSGQHLAGLVARTCARCASISSRRQHGPRGRAPARVAHARGVVADDEDDGVAGVLELAQLAAAPRCGRGGGPARSGRGRA